MKMNFDFLKFSTPVFIEIRGRRTLHAEGYCRIEEYSEEKIKLSSDEGSIAVFGEGLNLCHLNDERIAVEGRIDRIEFI